MLPLLPRMGCLLLHYTPHHLLLLLLTCQQQLILQLHILLILPILLHIHRPSTVNLNLALILLPLTEHRQLILHNRIHLPNNLPPIILQVHIQERILHVPTEIDVAIICAMELCLQLSNSLYIVWYITFVLSSVIYTVEQDELLFRLDQYMLISEK